MIDKGIIVIPGQMLILSEYPNNKKYFIRFMSITASLANYKRVGICPMQNKGNSASSAVCRNKR